MRLIMHIMQDKVQEAGLGTDAMCQQHWGLPHMLGGYLWLLCFGEGQAKPN